MLSTSFRGISRRIELSTSAELPLRLHWAALLHSHLRCSIAVTGGVARPADGVKAILAGAHAVQLVSAILRHGPGFVAVMRDGSVDMETCLTMLKYAKVLDFVMTTLASRRDIKPQTLRVIFKLAGLKVDEAYPG